ARAKELRPNARWAALRLFEIEARDGHWQAAGNRLNEAARRRMIPEARARHHRGVIQYELSRAVLAEGDRRRALTLAADAQNATPDLAVPAAFHARLLLAESRTGPAARAVERAWREAPGAELARVWSEIHAGEAPLAQFKNMERLAAQNPADRESHLALAEAALMAGLPGEARRRLDMARAAPPGATPRLCLLLARLEEAEGGTPARQREWLDRAAAAPPDPRYVCENCRGESLDWASRCPHCGGFDTLSRGIPSWAAPGEDVPALARTDPAKDDTAGFYLPEEPLGARFGTG
ncbi:MAG TPA: hypothetical protein VGF07_07890, partial [Stellaceae bacterium]